MIIGLTGGIACGKSTVAGMLAERGARIVDADKIAREVVQPGSPALEEIAARFGREMIMADGSLNRKKLGELVFRDPEARKALEAIQHPRIRAIMLERMAQYERENPAGLVVADIPLLYESGLETWFPEVMVVYVPREVQIARLTARDGLTREQAEARLQAQLPIEEKKRRADFVIDNSGTLADTERQVEAFWRAKGLT
jgi:dephospho-CoA kinase